MTAEGLNGFLQAVSRDPSLQNRLRQCDAAAAEDLARHCGFEVTVGDLIRYKARSTSWRLSDAELAVVAEWQGEQPYWWQHIWPE